VIAENFYIETVNGDQGGLSSDSLALVVESIILIIRDPHST
jgi:hypothetical protein